MARKKLQKAFALLLTFSMLMSLLSVTAFADEPETHEHDPITCEDLDQVAIVIPENFENDLFTAVKKGNFEAMRSTIVVRYLT